MKSRKTDFYISEDGNVVYRILFNYDSFLFDRTRQAAFDYLLEDMPNHLELLSPDIIGVASGADCAPAIENIIKKVSDYI